MNLSTHFVFAIAVGFVFFGRPELALLVGLGALLPDLDREYWFIPQKEYRDEQYHRALFHNVFVMALAYLVSPFISLGMFLHVFQDSFTTIKDRGCEWLYPVTRLVERGRKDANGNDQPLDQKERVYFYQEDPKGLLENADPDLRVVGDRPCPWRRTYGPALNGQLLDSGFFLGSVAIILVWILAPDGSHLAYLSSHSIANWIAYVVGYAGIAVVFVAGELDRRDRSQPLRIAHYNFIKYPVFAAGAVLFFVSIILYWTEILANLEATASDWISISLGILLVALLGFAVVKWQTKQGKTAVV